MKKPLWKKILTALLCVILALVLTVGAVVWATWHNEISTLLSMTHVRERNDEHLDGSVYTMHVKGGFYLDEFVAQGGVKSDSELIAFVTEKITKAIKEVGVAGGYLYIFDIASGIPYISETLSTDVTSAVKAKLGIQ